MMLSVFTNTELENGNRVIGGGGMHVQYAHKKGISDRSVMAPYWLASTNL